MGTDVSINERLLPELISAGVAEAFRNKGYMPVPPRTGTVIAVNADDSLATVEVDGDTFITTTVRTLVPVAPGDRVVIDFTSGGGVWIRGVIGGSAWISFANFALAGGLGIGNGTITARHSRRGREVAVSMHVVLGSTSAAAGQFIIQLPVQAAPYDEQILFLKCFDSSTGAHFYGCVVIGPGSFTGALFTGGPVTDAAPFVWTNGDNFTVSGTYEST